MPVRKDLFGCPGELPWLAGRIALVGRGNWVKDVRFLFSPLTTPPLRPPKREYNAVSATADEIWQYRMGGSLTIFDKDHDTTEEGLIASPPEAKFLQPSIQLRYNYYVQLVAIWRARVP